MLIVTLVATLAGTMLWQQWRAVQVEAAERARTQAAWILTGAVDWARLILREDNPTVDHLGEPWAVPLAEARLSSFLAADRESAEADGPEAFLSGRIFDAQSRYNLNNLVSGGEVVAVELATLQRLFESIGVPTGLAGDDRSRTARRRRRASLPGHRLRWHPLPAHRPVVNECPIRIRRCARSRSSNCAGSASMPRRCSRCSRTSTSCPRRHRST